MTEGEPWTIALTSLGGFAPRNRSRVSDNEPSTGSTTVRSKIPFTRPIFRNIVGRFLSMEVSKISARQMDDGGAVNAYLSASFRDRVHVSLPVERESEESSLVQAR
jgi:hypothetical protein